MAIQTRARGLVARAGCFAGVVFCASSALIAPELCAGQLASDGRPVFAHREVRIFDFEEIETTPAPVPMYWVRAQDSPEAGRVRPGFPIWNAAELDGSRAHGGVGSVRLPIAGGSASLLLERGVLPVFERADYVITARVYTEGLVHARARVVARYLGADGEVLPGSERSSDLVRSEGFWTPVRVEMPGEHEGVSFLQIELLVLQPEQFRPRTLGARQVFDEDFHGSAWFDDVAVSQLPRVEIGTASACNIFVHPAIPDLNFAVRDLTGERLAVDLTVQDSEGVEVDRQSRPLTSGRTMAAWQPNIERLGWYRAEITVRSDLAPLATAHADFLWIPAPAEGDPGGIRGDLSGLAGDWRRFEIIATTPHPRLGERISDLADRVRAGAVTVPVWEGLIEPGSTGAGSFIAGLLDRGRRITIGVPRVPQSLADAVSVDPGDPWELARRGPELWGPFVDAYLDRHGQSVRRWEVGPSWDDRVFWDPARARTLANVRRVFERLVPGPILCIPWRADLAVTGEVVSQLPRDAMLRILVPSDMPGGSIASVARSIGSLPGGIPGGVGIVLASPTDDRTSRREAASEAGRRLVEFWRSFGGDSTASVALLEPWTWPEPTRGGISPGPELAALANLAPRLSGRRFAADLPLGPGIRAMLFAPSAGMDDTDGGVVIAWDESGASVASDSPAHAYLGSGRVRAFDVFGNEIPRGEPADESAVFRQPPASAGASPEVLLRLDDELIVIEGVDPRMALFHAGLGVEPSFIDVGKSTHEHAIVVRNPWPVAIDVALRIVKPGGVEGESQRRDRTWRVSPRQARVTVPAGGEQRVPVECTFGPGEEAGPKEFVIDVDVASDQSLGSMRVRREVVLGSERLDLELSTRIDRENRVAVEAYVSNRGRDPLDVQLTAFAPGMARLRAVISNMEPGAVGTRIFRYGDASILRGQRVYVMIEDVVTGVRLNKAIVVP
ncbi:MAG: hypothetical protein KF787_11510 [Phycisphaeraceae bacterium]|nr:hypothetical protein [Phycisphaerae bacterium]MBX3393262.1 hypothetical protein [Phycisphaeraceae bacterium]